MEGLRVGFEIHQQLATHKLFCNCESELREEEPELRIIRRLRPTQSELGEIDRAALQEYLKGRCYEYEVPEEVSCLVEMDEEPPHNPNPEAVKAVLEVALLLNARPVDEIHFMRKIVIDGSNTSGFQRTAIVAMDGYIETSQGRVRIPTICLEEEAARKVREEGRKTVYRLDRLGIPLIEITTSPDITSLEEAREVALKIGEVLRATGRVKRGIGTIRQDINVSIAGGARVEIKGVQELNLIPRIIEREAERQRKLVEIAQELKKRGVAEAHLEFSPADVSGVFASTESKLVARVLKGGGSALAVKLPGFGGLIGGAKEEPRLGSELAQYARVKAGVGGIFHSDELPGYGISADEVESIARRLALGESDAFVLVVEARERALKALEAVVERARQALRGVPEETRVALGDGDTRYMRPLPGAARMYPETDLAPFVVGAQLIAQVRSSLPELYEEKISRFVRQYSLSEELAAQVVRSQHAGLFEELVESGAPPRLVATTLIATLRELLREGCAVERIRSESFRELFSLVAEGKLAKEAIPEVIRALSSSPEKSVEGVMQELGLEGFSEAQVRELARRVIEERAEFVRERGEGAAKPLMGLLMKELRGRVEGKLVMKILREEIRGYLER
ncbi:Glu-tRNA(Gln) amidotransferase subunit GatE [Candidatus Pyrohabitans sp.]